mgnify:CR=1 FL=1
MNPIHPQTQIGVVSLTVADFRRSLPYYTQKIGLRLLNQSGNKATLGTAVQPLLELIEKPGSTVPRGTTGLFHFALLVPSRLELARTFKNLVDTEAPLGGFSDHSVSEAIYLSDPDGNGIEIYRDRTREEWPYLNGRLQMNTMPLDLQSLVGELSGQETQWAGLHQNTKMGHIHLHIRDLDEAEAFYCDALGFERVMRYGTAAGFVSAGGYHHHIGLNTWAGKNAPPPPAGSAGLRHYQILLPDQAALNGAEDRLGQNSVSYEKKNGTLILQDPSQNSIQLTVTP